MNPTDNMVIRTRLDETDDSGPQQRLRTRARKREHFGGEKHKVARVQSYGFTNHAPKGSHGFTLVIGGNPDQAYVLGTEHADHRPKNLPEGEAMLYDDQGQVVHLKRDKILIHSPNPIHITTDEDCIITTGGICHINPP